VGGSVLHLHHKYNRCFQAGIFLEKQDADTGIMYHTAAPYTGTVLTRENREETPDYRLLTASVICYDVCSAAPKRLVEILI
jgi:hypothetical protein